MTFGNRIATGALAVALFASTEGGPLTAVVRSGTLSRTIRVTGTVAAAESAVLRAPYLHGNRSRGSPSDFNLELMQLIEPGRSVREGDVVAVFDNENMRNRLDNDEADVAEAQGAVSRLRADQQARYEAHEQKIRVARAAVDSAILDLKTARVRSQIDAQKIALTLEEARATLEALKVQSVHLKASQAAQLRSAELELERATVDARRARSNLERLTVRAPMDGLVVAEQVYRNGQFAQIRQGDQLRPGQPYVRIADLGRMAVEATVNQVDATDLRTGQPVTVRFDAFPDLALAGRVDRVGAMARSGGSRAGYVADIPLTIMLAQTDPRVLPDLTASGDIQVATADSTILPRQAVFDERTAFVRTAVGWERRELEVELTDHLEAAVKSGVLPGETVALERPAVWREGRSAPSTSVSPKTTASPGG